MKTLKQFLEVYEPKSPDEKRFKDKHVTIKHQDRNGNGDDVFQATNVKKAERTKERHGYEPGEDEKVYEEKGMPFEGPYRKVGERKDQYGNPVKNVAKHLAKKAMNAQKNEEVEQVDELSKKTLGSYVVKSLAPGSEKSVSNLASKGGYKLGQAHDDDYTAGEKEDAKSVKRSLGVLTAVRKMTKEQVAAKLTAESIAFAAAKKYGTPKEEVVVEEITTDEAVAEIFASGAVRKLYQPALLNIFEQLSDENQVKFAEQLQTPEGVESLINFAIQNRGE